MASPNTRPEEARDPLSILELHFSFAPSRVLAAGVQLDLFSHLAGGPRLAVEVAQAARASERGTRMLLDALAVIGLVEKRDGAYALTPASARYLVRRSPEYMGAAFETDWHSWDRLAEAVRQGGPVGDLQTQGGAEQFFSRLVRTLDVVNREPARRLAEALGAGRTHRGMRVLDVACGSGVWGIAVAEADRQARVTAQDYGTILELTRDYARRHGVEARYEFLPGDLDEVRIEDELYDLALLGHIVHGEGERSARRLFHRVFRALKPGGRIGVIDILPNEERTGPPYAVLFALEMLVQTPEGGTYTLSEYTAWLKEAGFTKIESADIASISPAIVARKP